MAAKRKTKVLRLKADPKNARLHGPANQAMIRKSLAEVGGFRSIAADANGIVRAGNGVFEAAQELGMEFVPVELKPNQIAVTIRPDLKGRAAERAGLLDNRSSDLSTFDQNVLSDLAQRDDGILEDIFNQDEIEAFRRLEQAETPFPEAPELTAELAAKAEKKWKTKPNQLWKIPSFSTPSLSHYLWIGDCLEMPNFEKYSLQGVFTSPPYAEQRKKKYGGIHPRDYLDWWEPRQKVIRPLLKADASFFLNLKAHCAAQERVTYVMELVLAMKQKWDWFYIDEFCWVKGGYPGEMGRRFRNAFEPIYQFAATTDYKFRLANVVEHRDGEFSGYVENLAHIQGARGTPNPVQLESVRPSNVLRIAPDQTPLEEVAGQPARFPPALPEFFIKAYSDEKDVWLDPFAGSGTTGVAAERLGRLSVMCEILPGYGAAILDRFEQVFGVKGELQK